MRRRAHEAVLGRAVLGWVVLVGALLPGCTVQAETRVLGTGVLVRRMQVLEPTFEEVRIADGLHLIVLPPNGSEGPHVVLEGHENLLRYVRVRNENGALRIDVEDGFRLDPAPTVQVVAAGLTSLRCVGAGTVEVFDLAGTTFEFDLTGSGSLSASGRVDSVQLSVVGSGATDLSELIANEARVETIGSGNVQLHADVRLVVSSIGSGVVTVSGEAEIERKVLGSGGVERAQR